MKKYVITIFAIVASVWLMGIVAVSCNKNQTSKLSESKRFELDSMSQYFDRRYEVYTLEGCEYIVAGVGKYQWGSHKGNCKNPIHQK